MSTTVSLTKNFAFIHVYKTAGTSITEVLKNCDGSNHGLSALLRKGVHAGLPMPEIHLGKFHFFDTHATANHLRQWLGAEKYDRLFSFGFVRNPWDFQVSLYHYERQITYRKSAKHQSKSFEEYLVALENCDAQRQAPFLYSDAGKQLVSFIGRFENINSDLTHIGKQIGISFASIQHLNASKHGHYRDYYNSRTVEIVRKLFAADIDMFGYKF